MRWLAGLFLAPLLMAPGPIGQLGQEAGQDLGQEPFQVWSAYLRETYPDAPILVIKAELRNYPKMDLSRVENPTENEKEALEVYNLFAGASATVEDRFEVEQEIVILTRSERDVMGKGRGPDVFYPELFRRYPGTPGVIELTPVGFSRDSTAAFFFPVLARGGLSCSGTLILMEKNDDQWWVKNRQYGGGQIIC